MAGTIVLAFASGDVEAHVRLEGAPEVDDSGSPWIVRAGICDEPGHAVGELGDYPGIVADEEGAWEGAFALEIDHEAESWIVEVRRAQGESETRIACGVVEREEA